MASVSRLRISVAVAATMLTFASPALAKKKARTQSAPAPTATVDPATQTADAVASEQPVVLPLVRAQIGWVKRCLNKDAPDECLVDGGFALDRDLPATMEISIIAGSRIATHPVTVLVPLDLRLQSGFALTLEGSAQAYVGTYSTCRAIGCYGQVVLDETAYDSFLKAKSIGVIVSNMSGRSVQLTAPLDGMTDAIAGPGITPDELAKRRADAQASMIAAAKARQEAAKNRDDAAKIRNDAARAPDDAKSPDNAKSRDDAPKAPDAPKDEPAATPKTSQP